MKKTLILLLILSFAGIVRAQDVYSVGYRMSEDSLQGSVIYKNGALLYSGGGTMNHVSNAVCLDPNDNLYWVNNVSNTDGSANYTEIHQNGASWFWTLLGSGTRINSLYWHDGADANPQNNLFAAGYATDGDTATYAVVWRGNAPSPLLTPDYGSGFSSVANDVCVNYTVNHNIDVLYCGYVMDSTLQKRATVWRNSEVLFTLSDNYAEAVSLACYHGHVYTLVNEFDTVTGNNVVKVFQDFYLSYVLSDPNYPAQGYQLKVDGGDVYVSGWMTSPDNAVVWKNCSPITYYSYQFGEAKSLDVTADGLFYTATSDSVPCIIKDGEVLYTLDDATELLDIVVTHPCLNEEVRALPYFEGFEMGETDWYCWTVTDEGDNFNPYSTNGTEYASYWHRLGNRDTLTYEGDHCAAYFFHPYYEQEGWLISPRFYLQPNRESTTLTFQSREKDAILFGYESVMVSTTGTDPDDFVEVWTPDDPSDEWKEITIDLSAFQGELVYIAFKYAAYDAQTWLIDNISLEEADYVFCEPVSAYPFLDDFEEEDLSCYSVVDIDQSGAHAYWQLTNDASFGPGTVLYHPRGEEGVPQEGWCITRPFVLQDEKDYHFAFASLVYESGEDMGNSVWIAVDVENPGPDDFTTCLWTDVDFENDWVDVNLDLSDYAGHTIHLAFKYEGTDAHGWCIDNLSITESDPVFVITVHPNNPQWGYTFGGGTYHFGESCTLGAIPVNGYDFLNWVKDGEVVSTSQTYTFTVTEDATYTAVFGEHYVQYYNILTNVTPSGSGEVTGGGTFAEGTVTYLIATPNTGWYFQGWSDGVTDNPRVVTVTGDITYTACFAQLEYQLIVLADPVEGGTVTGSGNYHYGDVVQLTATPAEGYVFDSWNDGVTLASRVVTINGPATYIATFVLPGVTYYILTAESADPDLGTVTGGGVYPQGTLVTLSAVAFEGAQFTHWNDGSIKETRPVRVIQDATYIAYFENLQNYTITVESLDPTMGIVIGGGTYQANSEITIEAIPFEGYHFDGWDEDNNYDNPRTILVTGDATYHARFRRNEVDHYTLTVVFNPEEGVVLGGGDYAPGTSVTVEAIPNVGYQFASWNDGLTDFVRTVVMNSDITLIAYFEPTSVGEDHQPALGVYPNPVHHTLSFTGLDVAASVEIYDGMGAWVKTVTASSHQEVDVSDLAPGLYLARVGNACVRFVVQ